MARRAIRKAHRRARYEYTSRAYLVDRRYNFFDPVTTRDLGIDYDRCYHCGRAISGYYIDDRCECAHCVEEVICGP